MRRFSGVEFAEVRSLLEEKRVLLKSGTIVDATIIAAPSSTKNAEGERDPEIHQTRKGKNRHFDMKVHLGTTKQGLVHSLATGPAIYGPTCAGGAGWTTWEQNGVVVRGRE